MNQDKSYLERAIEYHAEKIKLYESVNSNFLYGILQYQELYKDLFTEKEYVTILHFCFNQTSSVKSFFSLLEEQLIEHGAIRMRRKQEEKVKQQEEKDKVMALKFRELEAAKKKEGAVVPTQSTQPAPKQVEEVTENKWAKRFLDLESKLKEQKAAKSTVTEQKPNNVVRKEYKEKKAEQIVVQKPKYDEKKMQYVEAVVKSLYNKGTYSLPKIAKMSGVEIETVKRILNK
ncbi:hypothetical protein [Bacillus sp. PS06]|uniref:hypothetical protein n=1 Tax=Bacillus sp. PS06 TaxID=2764176 RepID=UPI00177D490A|nr:hypothetical protein [Bacillus sp. PS06]MBD8068930.1 hypothetical protein [Bacillus sp. PS06]